MCIEATMRRSGSSQREKPRSMKRSSTWSNAMRPNYDFSKARKNPYVRQLKKQITIRLDSETIRYFKSLAAQTGVSYQTLINLYLRDCAAGKHKLKWA